jgi:hypothetical protein
MYIYIYVYIYILFFSIILNDTLCNVSLQNDHMLVDFSHVSVYYFYLFLINVRVRVNLRVF